MATAVARPVVRRADDTFFVAMSGVILATVLFGFAHSYFLRGMMLAPLPSALVHVHGAVFTTWVVLYIVQTALVAKRKIRLHRTLGTFGAALAAVMVVIGIAATLAMVARGATPRIFTPAMFLVLNCWGVTLFALMVAWAVVLRRNGAAHKRLMLLATIGIMPPAITRWPLAIILQKPWLVGVVLLTFCLTVVAFDLATRRRPHWATVAGMVLVLSLQPTAVALGKTPLLQHAAHRLMTRPCTTFMCL